MNLQFRLINNAYVVILHLITCTEEELSQGCEDISLDKLKINHSFLRKLVSDSFCDDMHDSFVRNKDKKISYLFDLNYGLIRKFSITLLVLTLSNIPLTILFIFIFKCSKNLRYIYYFISNISMDCKDCNIDSFIL